MHTVPFGNTCWNETDPKGIGNNSGMVRGNPHERGGEPFRVLRSKLQVHRTVLTAVFR